MSSDYNIPISPLSFRWVPKRPPELRARLTSSFMKWEPFGNYFWSDGRASEICLQCGDDSRILLNMFAHTCEAMGSYNRYRFKLASCLKDGLRRKCPSQAWEVRISAKSALWFRPKRGISHRNRHGQTSPSGYGDRPRSGDRLSFLESLQPRKRRPHSQMI